MKKAWIIVFSIIIAVILLFVILSFTVFSLKSVKIDYRTNKVNITATDDEIIESGDIELGGSVFFRNKQSYIDKIEYNNPYVKVINIETVFPSSFVIHIAERQEVFAIEHNMQYYIVDEEYKVLRITDEFISDQTNAMLLSGIQIDRTSYAVGEFMVVNNIQPIYTAFFENNRPLNEQQAMIEKINFTNLYDENIGESLNVIELYLYSGQTFKIINSTYGLVYKVGLMLDVFSQIYDFIGQTVKIDGQQILLTEENLKTATIEIKNYYDYTQHGENDCYFEIYV